MLSHSGASPKIPKSAYLGLKPWALSPLRGDLASGDFPPKREITTDQLPISLVAGVFWLRSSGISVTVLHGESGVSPDTRNADADRPLEERK